MIVSELIELLKQCDPHLNVQFADFDEGVDKDINGLYVDGCEVYLYDLDPANFQR